jgi:hypothetical protein
VRISNQKDLIFCYTGPTSQKVVEKRIVDEEKGVEAMQDKLPAQQQHVKSQVIFGWPSCSKPFSSQANQLSS